MLKQLLFKGCLGVFCSVVCLGSLPAYSQPGEVIAQASQQTLASKNVSKDELKQFAQAVIKLQAVDEATQQKMVEAVQAEGLSPEQFMEIGKKQRDTNAQGSGEITPEDKQKFEKALAVVKKINEEDREKKREAVEASGLDISRFNEIGKTVEGNPELQKQVVELLQR
ncbi:DUF4168 domain-containing protein [Crocosphaera sp. UHCC 0190]|uniref:DUF4168 domain-containing protein n=1 Tax=Crocosphaera sp. UHCC 0190 TaxID=3110246 RepID=UPI002B1EC8EF|nr:DUF4168 domain-containing protein [Crocosphaera sp. UHCC 0190]MEA5511645.1 DUF4168 domain-containing protein [Crocosphaera sp. UHCC 0190]